MKITRPVPPYRPPGGKLSIIHEDEHILVIDKPSGLLTVPGKQPGANDSLQTRAAAYRTGAEITHRLDWDTSGIVVVALNKPARRHIGIQFEKRQVEKHYIARIWGKPEDDSGVIDLPLRCDWPNRPLQIVDHLHGRDAVTAWAIMTSDSSSSYLKLKPKTGRSHQLRVHCQSMGHPILGDRLYAHEEAYRAHERMCLHASFIAFTHPVSGKTVQFQSDCPF